MRETFMALWLGRITSLTIVMLLAAVMLVACQAEAAPVATQAVPESSSPAAPALPTTIPTEAALPVTGATEAPAVTAPAATEPAATETMATEPAATQPMTATVGQEAGLNVYDHPVLGPILVDNNGMTLYMFTRDDPNKSNCAGECLEKWPPLLTQGNPTLGEGVDPALVGAAPMPDGTQIVTYNEMPLYYWYEDFKPGDAFGQDVGDVWYVVSPQGEIIRTKLPEDASPAATMAPSTTAQPAAAAAGEAELSVYNDPTLGPILVGNNGMTLYMFTKDEPNKVNCAGECLEKWPPLLTQGNPTLGEGVDASLVGTAPMADGSMIVTYKEMPLYYWFEDFKPGNVFGQGVGDVWYVVSPQGEVIKDAVPEQTNPDAAGAPANPAAAAEPSISVFNDPKLGPILVGDNGMTLYMFDKDEPNKVNCAGECLEKWPPLLTQGNPTLGEGVDTSLIGTARMADGSQIITYNGMPLYYWYKDTKAGDTTGQAVGEVWWVVSPAGDVIRGQAPAAATAPAATAAPASKEDKPDSNKESKDTDY